MASLDNVNPEVFKATGERQFTHEELDESVVDEFDSREVFDMLRCKLHSVSTAELFNKH